MPTPPPRPARRWPVVVAAVLVALVAAGFVAALVLDSLLLSAARRQAATLSARLGRPVEIEGVRTKLLGGLGVRVTGVTIGAAPGEKLPLASLARAELRADLWTAARSRGRDLHVREAVVEGLRVNVVRLADGTTNLQRTADALSRGEAPSRPAQPPGAEGEAKPPADLSGVRIDRAALENARVAFLDEATPGARELTVSALDVEVRDLAAGRPLELVLRAAVLAEKQNLELRVASAPLPASLVPTPVAVRLRAEPIDLAPLAPFVPPSVGFRGGRFEADLDAALGAAAPGGSGPTKVKGGFKATGLRFEGQQGGRPLDVVFESDLDADVGAGDLRIGALRLDAGPAHVTGHGRVAGFTGASPRVEGLEVVVTGLDPEALAEYYPPLRRQVAGRVAGPIGLTLRGGGGADAQTLELRVDLAPVRLAIPDAATKATGAPLSLVARARGGGAGAPVAFDVALDAAGVDLRPGGSLAKKPGDPLSAHAVGTWRKEGAVQRIELSRLDLDLLGDRLAGKGRVALASRPPSTRFDAEVEGARLDADRLLLPAPKAAPGPAGKGPARPAGGAASPDAFAGLEGEARLKLGTLRVKGVDARNVVARLKVKDDEVTVEEARLEALGGTVSAAGTKVRLAHREAPFRLVADLKGIQADRGTALLWDRKVVTGAVDAKLDLQGQSLEEVKASAVTGLLGGALRNGAFLGADLTSAVLKPIASRLPFGGKVVEGGATSLGRDLSFAFEVANGLAKLSKPLEAGDLTLTGGVRTDGTLEMPATLKLTPELVAKVTGGRARPAAPIPVTFRLGGPAWHPTVSDVGVEGAVREILKGVAAGALGAPAAKATEAIAGKRAQAEGEVKAKADEARKRAEEAAKKGLQGLFGK